MGKHCAIVTYLAANGPGRRCSPSVAAGTAAILVRRTGRNGRAKYIEQREGIYRLSRRSGLQIGFLPCIRCVFSVVGGRVG